MSSSYFSLDCPTCGRKLLIRVEHLGRKVQCQHCGGMLVACDPVGMRYGAKTTTLLERADELLESAVESAVENVAEEDDVRRTPNPR